jgi:hypothetical protein
MTRTRVKKPARKKRNRKTRVIDVNRGLTGEQIKSQLEDFTGLLRPKLFPPKSKKAMKWKGSDQIFSNPTLNPLGAELRDLITQNYSTDIPEEPASLHFETDSGVTEVDGDTADTSSISEEVDTTLIEDSNTDMPSDTPCKSSEETEYHTSVGEGECFSSIDTVGHMDDVRDQSKYSPTVSEEHGRWKCEEMRLTIGNLLQMELSTFDAVYFSSLTHHCNRKQVVSRFAACLMLLKEGIITVTQTEPYADIQLQRGPQFLDNGIQVARLFRARIYCACSD